MILIWISYLGQTDLYVDGYDCYELEATFIDKHLLDMPVEIWQQLCSNDSQCLPKVSDVLVKKLSLKRPRCSLRPKEYKSAIK